MRRWREWIVRFFLPRSLRYQLLSRSLIILSVLLVLIGFLQYLLMKHFIYQNKADSIHSQVVNIARQPWISLQFKNGDRHPERPMLFIPGSGLAFVDLNGNYQILSDFPQSLPVPRLSPAELEGALQDRSGQDYLIVKDEQGAEQLVVLLPVGPRGHIEGLLQVSTGTNELKEVLLRQLLIFLALALLALLVGLSAFLPVLKRTLVLLSNMVRTVERIDAGNLDGRLQVRQGQLELDRLSQSFNGMLERLEASFLAEKEAKEQMRRFIADASHELRTPLTSIHGFLEVLLRGALKHPEQLEKSLRVLYGESERINKLVEDLLLLAKLDRAPVIELSPGNLDQVIEEMIPQLRAMAGQRSVLFSLAPGMSCRFDRDKLKQVMLNLFSNAVKHTDPASGRISVTLAEDSGEAVLTVRDNGSGIDPQHLPHIFERFYRVDSSRTRKQGGAGLGLSITKSIIDRHDGTIRAESKPGEGSLFEVRLPVV